VATQTPAGQEAPAGQASTGVQVQTLAAGSAIPAVLPTAPWQSADVLWAEQLSFTLNAGITDDVALGDDGMRDWDWHATSAKRGAPRNRARFIEGLRGSQNSKERASVEGGDNLGGLRLSPAWSCSEF
jgi:hypothetical protein